VLRRQRTGSVICTNCGVLVGVSDATCYNCGRRNPGLWGYAPILRALGGDMGFVPFVIGACVAGQQSGHIFIENGRFHGQQIVADIVKESPTQ